METKDRASEFIAILSGHNGLARAISVADMAGRLGFERDKAGQRRAQKVKEAVVAQGVLVGSSCLSKRSGWFAPANSEEIAMTLHNYKARIRSMARTIRQTEGAAGYQKFVGELALEFSTGENHAV